MNTLRRIISSMQNYGLQTTLVLAKVRLQGIIELILPRTIWGERIGLRPIRSHLTNAEIEQVYSWSRDDDILRWSGGNRSEVSFDMFRKHVYRERWKPLIGQRIFYIVTREGDFIGRIMISSINWIRGEGELGIILGKNHWSKHYGREAIELILTYIFSSTQFKRVYLGTFKDNLRAQHAFASCGFKMIGTAEKLNPVLGQIEDGVVMEITRADFMQKNHMKPGMIA